MTMLPDAADAQGIKVQNCFLSLSLLPFSFLPITHSPSNMKSFTTTAILASCVAAAVAAPTSSSEKRNNDGKKKTSAGGTGPNPSVQGDGGNGLTVR